MSNIIKTIGNFRKVALVDAGKSKLVSSFIAAKRAVDEIRSSKPLNIRENDLDKAATALSERISEFNTVMITNPVQTKTTMYEGADEVEDVLSSNFLLLTDEQMKQFKIKDGKIDLKDSVVKVKKFYTSKVNSIGKSFLSPINYVIVESVNEEHFSTVDELKKSLFGDIKQFGKK